MKFLRFYNNDKIKTAYFDGKKVIELEDSIEKVLNSWKNWKYMKNQMKTSYSLESINFAPPITPSKIICVGLNYKDHAEEFKMEIPDEPKIFLKPPSAIIGHGEVISYPKSSNEIDYEGELAIVIMKKGKNIAIEEVHEYIGGYTILNDVTARDLQRKDEQWTRAKSFDTFAPTGPFIETEMDPSSQNISLKINGEIKQKSNTKNMIFSPQELVEFISNIMTLNPGDIIATGTPSGVGEMKSGDIVEVAIDDIGVLKNKIM
ncbi:MAG: fumarylacetoacetate hydrolase family protein [Methanobacteriaceae archaeon]|jgi:2-keto-4-pentenoate hydratase/2-oxohepta-3-ene-1,7-dioic acid hydratase in catechol pathway|nr:fumarylacetoacetate hydrolase family protein [Candidatus Methanorudis spinitermitis]